MGVSTVVATANKTMAQTRWSVQGLYRVDLLFPTGTGHVPLSEWCSTMGPRGLSFRWGAREQSRGSGVEKVLLGWL